MTDRISSTSMRLSDTIDTLPGIGARRAQAFDRLGIQTISDLLRHMPLRYEHHLAESPIAQLQVGTLGTTQGTLAAVRLIPSRQRSKTRLQATLDDGQSTLMLTWFNAAYLQGKLHPGLRIRVTGKVGKFDQYLQMVNPKWQWLDEEDTTEAADTYLPIYPATEGLDSTRISQLIRQVLAQLGDRIPDPLPRSLLEHHAMPSLKDALRQVHLPRMKEEPAVGRRRLAYNELLLLQLGIVLKRQYNHDQLTSPQLRYSPAMDEHIRQRLGFTLTESQSRVVGEIASDLTRSVPMNRLVQGDVGSGKTAVALYGLLLAVANGCQGALMAPTELLAEQHYLSIRKMLKGANVRIALCTASQSTAKSAARRQLFQQIQQGNVDIIIGTQTLVSSELRFHKLALVVVDEQHRFGVLQRAAFRNQTGQSHCPNGALSSPHYLVMTATPIPRTLSLTLFGDLDISTIQGLPPGRQPVITRVVHPDQTDQVYAYLADRLAQGEQAYVVVPAIDADTQSQSATPLKNVTDHAKMLKQKFFADYEVATLHGRLHAEVRASVMEKFRQKQIQVLVATTVIEVGVDVPDATMMVVEHADRFGLSQLHQLRGRIGRGNRPVKNLCVFVSDPTTENATQRMQAIAQTTDGFRIAEADLEIRGMGDFFGTRQHGITPLRVAHLIEDMDLLQLARRDAQNIIRKDPWLRNHEHQPLRNILYKQYGDDLPLIDVG